MATDRRQRRTELRPTVAGTGLITLDVVVPPDAEEDTRYFAGGTCGNVLTVLSYLGWEARPLGRLAQDDSAQLVLDDLHRWQVDTSGITRTTDGSTPVIIQNIRETPDGTRSHSFSLRCPCCGAYLPGYKPILKSAAPDIAESLGTHQVFFLDRVSRGTLMLAEASAAQGALVVFEPSGVGEPRLFREAWSIAHVVKYSNERLRDIADLELGKSVRNDLLLEIETLGASGLRYRSRLPEARTRAWKTLGVISGPTVRDAAGSGDWCTAGLIQKLARGGHGGFCKVTLERLEKALRYGQALAAWNCGFEGARGGMYQCSKSQFDRRVRSLVRGDSIQEPVDESSGDVNELRKLCPACDSTEVVRQARTG